MNNSTLQMLPNLHPWLLRQVRLLKLSVKTLTLSLLRGLQTCHRSVWETGFASAAKMWTISSEKNATSAAYWEQTSARPSLPKRSSKRWAKTRAASPRTTFSHSTSSKTSSTRPSTSRLLYLRPPSKRLDQIRQLLPAEFELSELRPYNES